MKKLNSNTRTRRISLILALAFLLSVALSMSVVFATGAEEGSSGTSTDSVTTGIFSGLQNVYSIINTIALPIAGLMLAFCAFKIWMGGERGMETAKRVGVYTLIALALVYLAPVIVKAVGGWFGGKAGAQSQFDGLING